MRASGDAKRAFLHHFGSTFVLLGAWFAQAKTATGQEIAFVLEGHKDIVRCVAFSPDGKTMATGSDDGTIRLWDLASGKEKASFDAAPSGAAGPVRPYAVAFAADGKVLLASVLWDGGKRDRDFIVHGSAGGVRAWDLESKKLRYTLAASWAPLLAVTVDGKTIATCDRFFETDVNLWDAETGKKIADLGKRNGRVMALSFSPDDKRLAVGTERGAIEIWDAATQKLLVAFSAPGGVIDLAFAPDGKTLAVGGHAAVPNSCMQLFEVDNIDAILLRDGSEYECNEGGWGCLKYSPDGKQLATGWGHVVRLLSPWSAAYKGRKGGWQFEAITCIAFSPDSKLLAIAGEDKVRVWKFGEE